MSSRYANLSGINLGTIVSIIPGLIIFTSYGTIRHYYNFFGIPIYSYLDASDLVMIFLNDISFYLSASYAFFLSYYLVYLLFNEWEHQYTSGVSMESDYEKAISRRNLRKVASNTSIAIGVSVVLIILLSRLIKDTAVKHFVTILFMGLGVSGQYFYWRINLITQKEDFKRNVFTAVLTTYIIILAFTVYYLIIENNAIIKLENSYRDPKGTTIVFKNNEVIKTGYDTVLVGETSRYIFIVLRDKNKAMILSRDEIYSIEYPKKNLNKIEKMRKSN